MEMPQILLTRESRDIRIARLPLRVVHTHHRGVEVGRGVDQPEGIIDVECDGAKITSSIDDQLPGTSSRHTGQHPPRIERGRQGGIRQRDLTGTGDLVSQLRALIPREFRVVDRKCRRAVDVPGPSDRRCVIDEAGDSETGNCGCDHGERCENVETPTASTERFDVDQKNADQESDTDEGES